MERIDVPLPSLEPEPEYVPPPRELRSRQIHGTISGSSAGEYHVYRLSRRREFANTQRAALEATLEKEKNEFAQQLEEKRKLDELQTEKKRLKRLKKKQNKNAKAQDQNKSDKSNTTNAKQPIEITSDTPKAEP
ncbi:hypothetical protein BC833DRAFT_580410 [Globomyces pollinis-pini]|nr:hypothetical protein BC833DRAFT_580410 [Globomyces pollinis-pini]